MKSLTILATILGACLSSSSCEGRQIRRDYGYDAPANDATTSIPTVASTAALSASTASTANAAAVTGDSQCTSAMCVSAVVTGSDVQYTLNSTGKSSLGWMAMGFGSSMTGTPMVIVWPNSDGTFTLSQRTASSHSLPTVDSNPPRAATLSTTLSTKTSAQVASIVYTIPANTDTRQNIIWAFGTDTPSSSDKTASFEQHSQYGTMTLNLAKVSGGDSPSSGGSSSSSPSSGTDSIPLTSYQRLIVAHAIFCTAGFALFLPLGALIGRYLRTSTPKWFVGHWIAQIGFAGPAIIAGVVLGFLAVNKAGGAHLYDGHMKWGVILLALYIVQCLFGTAIHFVKRRVAAARPVQNYVHAVLGLAIIGLGFYQVHNGYDDEWPKMTGREALPKSVTIIYAIWLVLVALLYFAGVALFLRRQLAQERKSRDMAAASIGMPDEYGQVNKGF